MDRNREARRGSMAAMNGGLSRRRQQRSANLRDSPEEDGVMEMRESSRLRDRDRDRGIKKDRDRSGGGSRSKRRRGERLIHGSNRDEGDDSSEESLDDEDDDEEEEAPVSVRFPPPPPPPTNPTPSSSSSLQQQQQQQQQSQNNHVRKSITSKPARPPTPSWKVAEEMIGVSIPRKARTSSLKRPQECGGGGGSGELIHRQASTSPSRRSPSSNTAVSPSSSNVSVRKKKQISGSKHRPPKSKSSSIQEIEIEVAEVLYGMTRQAPAPPPVLSSSRQDTNGLSNEAKSIPRVSSPGSFSPPPPTSSQPSVLPTPNLNSSNNSAPSVTTAPKRKRPRLKLEDESPTIPATKPDTELPGKPEEGSAPVSPLRSEKKMAAAAASPAVENGSSTALTDVCAAAGGDHMQESAKPESSGHVPEQKEAKEEIVLATASKSKEAPCSNLNALLDKATVVKDGSEAMKVDSPREEKFSIDLMAPPPPSLGNSERDGSLDYASDHKPVEQAKEMRLDIAKGEMEKPDRSSKQQEAIHAASAEDIVNKHVATEKPMLDLQLDLEKQDKDKDKDVVSLGSSSKHQQQSKQQPKMPRIDPKPEKKAQSAASLPLTMPIAGWPGGFPHFGYMGQVPPLPAVMPMDGSSAASKTLQPPHFFPPQKMKRCATHCYIAKTINYNQQIARMNIPFWPPAAAAASAAAAVGTSPMYAAKQHNLNLVPPSEAAILGNPLQGSFPGRSLGPLQDKASPAVAMTYAAGPPAKEKSSAAAAAANNPFIEAQRKQLLLQQQIPQPVSSAAGPNMLHGPAAFIFPIGQQPAAAAAAAAATRSGTSKATPVIGNAAPSTASGSSIAASSGPAGHSTTSMNYYAGLQPSEAQYLAFLQNNGYAFPMPAHLGGGPPYRGANPSQAMPFFNGSFYSSPMLHPSSQQQFRQQQQQQQSPSTHQQPPAHSQQGHQNTSTSSGSSSSQKHHTKQQQRVPGGGAAAGATPAGGNNHNFPAKQHLHLLPSQARQLESEAGCEDSPSTADSSRASQAQKSIYGNFAMSIHPQNFALLSPAAAAAAAALPSSGSGGGGGGGHNEKQQPVQNHANLAPSQAYAMSFAPFGGPAAAAAAGGAQGLDFTSMVQNHALFHSLPEAARHHGYQQITAVATAAAAAQAAQHKKSHHEDGKSVGDAGAVSANVTSEEGKMMASTGKSPGGVAQHSLSFSRPDNDLKTSTILGNSSNIPEGSSRTLNLIQPPANGVRASNRPSSAAPATSSPVANAANPTASNLHMQSSQQQHLIQLQKMQQQQQQLQQLQLQQQMSSRSTKGSSHSTNNATTIYSDRMAAGSMSRFSGFPPSIIQSASPAQSPQWKASGRSATPGPANSATTSSSSAKNQLQQQQQQQQQQHQHHQQGRNQQQHQQALLSSNVHQTQISFGVSSSKAVGVSGQPHLASNSSLAAASAAGSPQGSVSKSSAGNGGGGSSGGNGSPRASSSSKSGQPPPTLLSPALPLHQQQTPAAKNSPSPSSSNLKSSSSPANNRNMTSILGHPQITPATNSSSSTKFQQQSQQQQQQQQNLQSFHQPQLFFNPYMQAAQSSQSNAAAAAANYYQQQRRHSEQQSQQHSQQSQQQQNSTNSGVLSLCPSPLTLAGSSPTSDPAKAARPKPTADQKAAPGSENLHWKPEKR